MRSGARAEADRFWEKVNVLTNDECWEWQAYTYHGYGKFRLAPGQGMTLAHRWALTQAAGECPAGKTDACHTCDNRKCVNPGHLYWGSRQENMDEMVARGRTGSGKRGITHCPSNHEYTPENTYATGGFRRCKICTRQHVRKWARRAK